MNGILVVDKPAGPTSADVVRVAKKLWREKTGHLGTLDPFATGVLPLCIGEATKVAQLLADADKEYVGVLVLGARTDTGDPTGRVVEQIAVPADIGSRLATIPARVGGRRLQTPPMYSAIKRDGIPLYKLARQGLVVDRPPREVEIEFLELEVVGEGMVRFRVRCSKGTYVRVLAEEIAAALGTVGHLTELRRLRFGPFRIEQAVTLDQLKKGEHAPLISIGSALPDLRRFPVPDRLQQRVRQGARDVLSGLPEGTAGERALLVNRAGEPVAVVEFQDRGWKYLRVLAPARA